jgi:ferrous iron transport protein B
MDTFSLRHATRDDQGGIRTLVIKGGINSTGLDWERFTVAIPANEIVIPTVLMLTVLVTGASGGAGAGVMFEMEAGADMLNLFQAGGWKLLTALNLMLFSLVHNSCSTTIYTIYKKTGSATWTAVAALLPLVMGFVLTFFVAQV